jgi:hypothetical protein
MAANHTKAAFDTHPGSRFITFIGNQVHGCSGPGFQIRGTDCQVIEPVVSGIGPAEPVTSGIGPLLADDMDDRSGVGVYFAVGAERGRLRGGRICNVPYGVVVRDSNGISIVGTCIQNVLRCGVYVYVTNPYAELTDLVIEDIDIDGSPAASGIDLRVWDSSYRIGRVRCSGLATPAEAA